jgi:hypothetical protein
MAFALLSSTDYRKAVQFSIKYHRQGVVFTQTFGFA